MGSMNWRRGTVRSAMACVCVCVCVSLCAMLAACSTSPKTDDLAVRLALQEEVNEHLAAADKALKAGQTDQAMARLDAAVKADPASKAPWLRKAQIHFDAREYGQAITQAQEVLQRDVNDLTAKSILAVSGLRVSAVALAQLRKVNEVNGSARSEAEGVARLIREALGEPILVPAAAAGSAPEPVKQTVKPVPRGNAARAAAPRATGVPAATGATSGRNNPFGALQ